MSRRIIVDELEFEVPYGKLAAKSWHEDTDECKRILALHGWMDNAGSFDNLMPLIKHQDGLYIVALDLPGHGKSSQLPPGSSYSDLNMVMEVRRCLSELKWIQPPVNGLYKAGANQQMRNNKSNDSISEVTYKINEADNTSKKFTIIGHSLGAGLGLFYSSLYPDDVEEVILLDFAKSKTTSTEELLKRTAETIDKFIFTVPSLSPFNSPQSARVNFANNNQNKAVDKGQVIVSQETAIIATIEAHKQLGCLSRDDATCLLKRSTVAVSTPPNSVIYLRDLRLQSMLNFREHWEINKIMFAGVQCHVLSILSKDGLYVLVEDFKDNLDSMQEFMSSQAKSFHLQWLDSDHYLHMNNSRKTADIINKYLESPSAYKVKGGDDEDGGIKLHVGPR